VLAAFGALAAAAIALRLTAVSWNEQLMQLAHHGVGTWATHVVIVAPLILLVRAPERAGWGTGRLPTVAAITLLVLALASARATENRMVWPALLASLAVVGASSALRWPASGRVPIARRVIPYVLLAALLAGTLLDVSWRKAESTQAPPQSIERSVAEDPRLAIWPIVRDRIADRPWIGYGYGKGILGPEIAREMGDPTLTHAHNAFASVWLQTGAIGLALFVAALAAAAWRFAGYARARDDTLALVGIAGLAILAGVLVKNLTDDFFFRQRASCGRRSRCSSRSGAALRTGSENRGRPPTTPGSDPPAPARCAQRRRRTRPLPRRRCGRGKQDGRAGRRAYSAISSAAARGTSASPAAVALAQRDHLATASRSPAAHRRRGQDAASTRRFSEASTSS
jgi:hypothetical protein